MVGERGGRGGWRHSGVHTAVGAALSPKAPELQPTNRDWPRLLRTLSSLSLCAVA